VTVNDGLVVDARLVAGSLGERPQRLPAAEDLLRGMPASEAAAAAAADRIREEVETVADAFESEAYKRQLARTVGRRAVLAAIRRAKGEEGGHRAA
jgi:CO/xanthine dehydrogenase FAD-binding subunit